MDHEAFSQAARTYGDNIYRLALHALRNPTDAEDIMQTVLLKLLECKTAFESEEHMKHWLLRVTVNECRKLQRSFWRRTSVPLENWDSPVLEDPDRADLLRAVMGLEQKYRLTVYLYYFEGYSCAEIADILNTRPPTVQSWLFRARKRLRDELLPDAQLNHKEGEGYVPAGVQ